jgi:cyclophilin family peptidyl-prolyl cis-trans isomerase
VTLDRLESFDKNFVAFGRVIEGFDLFKRIKTEQQESSLHPTANLKIVSAEFYIKKLPGKLPNHLNQQVMSLKKV